MRCYALRNGAKLLPWGGPIRPASDDEPLWGCFYLEETQRAVQLMVEEDISSIHQMPEINPGIRHSALFLASDEAHIEDSRQVLYRNEMKL